MDEALVKRVARAAGRAFSEVTDGAILSTVETEAMAHIAIPLVGEFCAGLAEERAAHLLTPPGRVEAQWHEHDAAMVAGELSKQARRIRAATTERNEDAE
jgi:hypothetical protein